MFRATYIALVLFALPLGTVRAEHFRDGGTPAGARGVGFGNQQGGGMFGGGFGQGQGGMGGGFGQQQGGGQQPQNNGKSREAAEKINKDGDEVRKNLTKATEQYSTGVNKLMDGFNSTLASLQKSSAENDSKEGLKSLAEMAARKSEDPATSTILDQIVSGYQAKAGTIVQQQTEITKAAMTLPEATPPVKNTLADKLAEYQPVGARAGNPLGDVQQASNNGGAGIPEVTGTHSRGVK